MRVKIEIPGPVGRIQLMIEMPRLADAGIVLVSYLQLMCRSGWTSAVGILVDLTLPASSGRSPLPLNWLPSGHSRLIFHSLWSAAAGLESAVVMLLAISYAGGVM
jgi:hypothetical protein